jgi:RsiW-degrading membrane proteinase PrsW (M82 family)
MIIYLFISIIPVVAFLTALKSLDSYKLLPLKNVFGTLSVGFFVALISLLVNKLILSVAGIYTADHSKYLAPGIEEFLKAGFIFCLIRSNKTGFMVDAAIQGFAIGAGFAIVENIYYIYSINSYKPLVSIVRGFGTAIMHGGATAIFGILAKNLYDKHKTKMLYLFPALLLPSILIHSLYNHFLISPVTSALGIIIFLPIIFAFVFRASEISLSKWLGTGFDTDAETLEMIKDGTILKTPAGEYLLALKSSFTGEVVADMLCLLRIHIELSLRAKGILLMKETGFYPPPDPDLKEKFRELEYLESNIGNTGMLAIHPLLRWKSRDLWQLHMLNR